MGRLLRLYVVRAEMKSWETLSVANIGGSLGLVVSATETAVDSVSTRGRGCAPTNIRPRTLTSEFHATVMCLEIVPF